jgi:hypothetical protein
MIDLNSNCSRVDLVKATANQLKMQVEQAPHTVPESDPYRKAQNQIDSLEQSIKGGDAKKAETALSTAKSAVQELQTQSQPASSSAYCGHLDVYA